MTSAAELADAVMNAAEDGETIFIADGTYQVEPMQVLRPNITVRSLSGDRDSVVLDGNYTENEFGNGTVFNVWASGVTIAHLTIRRAYTHGVHVSGVESGDVTDALLYDLHLVDMREQQVKVNAGSTGTVTRRGRLACSRLELTEAGRAEVADYGGWTSCYTGGIDLHQSHDWVVESNFIEGIYCSGRGEQALAEHGVHFWSTNHSPIIRNNVIVDCARGIGLGMGDEAMPEAAVYDNLVYASPGFAQFDTAIELEGVSDATLLHNTIAGPVGLAVNMRRDGDTGTLANNILMGSVRAVGGVEQDHNVELTDLGVFASTDPRSDDFLRLGAAAGSELVDAGADYRAVCPTDIDGDARDEAPDIGADER